MEQNGSLARDLQRPSSPTAQTLQCWPKVRAYQGHCPNACSTLTGLGHPPTLYDRSFQGLTSVWLIQPRSKDMLSFCTQGIHQKNPATLWFNVVNTI